MSTYSPFSHLHQPVFHQRTAAILVVDDFYTHPDEIRAVALETEYEADLRYFKGVRSKEKFLFPWVKEEFERLLRVRITDWLDQPANGSFQKTTAADPLVWHSDTQSYAAAIYLTPHRGVYFVNNQPREGMQAGTSFWRNATTGARRPPSNAKDYAETYSEFNLTHADNWELVDRVGSVYNRLVLWDAQLIHSATSYEGFTDSDPRLVQLFFFNVAR
jgi:hypothetical protein